MAIRITRRTLLGGAAGAGAAAAGGLLAPGAARADEPATDLLTDVPADEAAAFAAPGTAYAAFRVVRARPGTPGRPQLTLPAGYSLVPGAAYQVASRAEYYAFVRGAASTAGITVSVRWPGQQIAAVVAGERRLAVRSDAADPARVSFTLPVRRATPVKDSGTIQVWSHLSRESSGLYWHVEHNDPARAAGYWASRPWPTTPAGAVLAHLVAARSILYASGLIERARGRGHFFALMGFETNNMLHQDSPPHWHLSYYPGPTLGAAKATVPHFLVDGRGRNLRNGQDVQGGGRTTYRVGQPAPIRDAAGRIVLTTTVRRDGGLDVDPPGGPRYTILAAAGGARILRGGVLWRTVVTSDDVRAGVLRTDVRGVGRERYRDLLTYRYDVLTGAVTGAPAGPLPR